MIYVANLEPAPVTGRKRFMIVSRELEKYLGDQGYEEMMQQVKPFLLPDYHPEVRMVKDVMRRLIKVCDETNALGPDIDWKVHVIDDPNSPPNALVLPGGKVFVFRSILPICANKDGLATVLAHETAHQVARHSAENLSRGPIYMILGLIMYTITGSEAVNQFLISSLLRLPASREMETEADYIGLMLMSKACFNPAESVNLWKRMGQMEAQLSKRNYLGVNTPEFLSTHPSSQSRITYLEEKQPEAQRVRELSGCDQKTSSFWSWQG